MVSPQALAGLALCWVVCFGGFGTGQKHHCRRVVVQYPS